MRQIFVVFLGSEGSVGCVRGSVLEGGFFCGEFFVLLFFIDAYSAVYVT